MPQSYASCCRNEKIAVMFTHAIPADSNVAEARRPWPAERQVWAGPDFLGQVWEKLMKENSHVYIEETRFRSCGRSRKGD
jgi:hypothetical protein